jgi:hypothetical protein
MYSIHVVKDYRRARPLMYAVLQGQLSLECVRCYLEELEEIVDLPLPVEQFPPRLVCTISSLLSSSEFLNRPSSHGRGNIQKFSMSSQTLCSVSQDIKSMSTEGS